MARKARDKYITRKMSYVQRVSYLRRNAKMGFWKAVFYATDCEITYKERFQKYV